MKSFRQEDSDVLDDCFNNEALMVDATYKKQSEKVKKKRNSLSVYKVVTEHLKLIVTLSLEKWSYIEGYS